MARRSGSSGIGTGLGLGVGAVGVNTCSSEDQSWFCQISRIFQIISWIFSILIFIWIAYMFFDIYVLSRRGKKSKGFWG
jgi:hypothetical protein